MSIPTLAEYQDAIQNPSFCFTDSELKNGQPQLNNLGLPLPITGGFASVYQITNGSNKWAIRCFLREYADQQSRYEKIHRFLRSISSPYLIDFDYQPRGIRVQGNELPILKMQWLEGQALNSYIKSILNNQAALQRLADDWITLIKSLKSIGIAHGDLQHGNILVCNGKLKLIDYDGMFVPTLAGQGSHETGHPSYQHPQRSGTDFNAEIDDFAALAIHTAILAVKCESNLWWQFNNDDNILFSRADFADPSQSQVFAMLCRLPDREIIRRARALLQACTNPVSEVPDIDITKFKSNTPDWLFDQMLISIQEDKKSRANRFAFSFNLLWKRPGIGYVKRLRQEPVYEIKTRTVTKTRVVTRPRMVTKTRTVTKTRMVTKTRKVLKTRTVRKRKAHIPFFLLDDLFGHYYVDEIETYYDSEEYKAPEQYQVQEEYKEPELCQETEQYQATETYNAKVGNRNVEDRVSQHMPGHDKSVVSVAFSHDGNSLLSGSHDNMGLIWECETGKRKSNLKFHTQKISVVANVGKYSFATASWDKTIQIWSNSGQKIKTLKIDIKSRFYAIASNVDGTQIAGGLGQRQIRLWDVSSGNEIYCFKGHTRKVLSVAFSPDANFIVSGSSDCSIRVWNIRQRECRSVLYGHTADVNVVAVSPDGKLIASGGNDGIVFIWNTRTGNQLMKINAKASGVYALVFSPDSQYVISGGSDHIIRCWDVNSGREIGHLDGHSDSIRGLAISTDGTKLASCGDDQLVMLWIIK